jgi:hypothetical protein
MTFIFLGLSVAGQGLKNLDTDFGIKKFKLESSFSLYKNDLEYYEINREDYYLIYGSTLIFL